MKRISKFLVLLLVPVGLLAQTTPSPQAPSIVFRHVTVIDATGAPARPDMTVVITGNRIAAISKKASVPKRAEVVDATGKFLIPGLWDMHIHIHRHDELRLLIVNGVTGVRVMGGVPEHHKMRMSIESGREVGPRMVIASRMMDGPSPGKASPPAPGDTVAEAREYQEIVDGAGTTAVVVANAADARQAVLTAKETGADFIKIHSDLSREAYFGLVDESKKQGLEFEGHLPTDVSAAEASDAGQKSIEHMQGILNGCTTREPELRAATVDAQSKPAQERAQSLLAVNRMALASYSPDDCTELAKRFLKNQTWLCPTLVSQVLAIDELSSETMNLLKYQPPTIRDRWQKQLEAADARKQSSEQQEVTGMIKERLMKEVELMNHAGVRFLAGTDTTAAFKFAGYDLHDELDLLNKSGLTPMEVIQSATRNPAIFFGREKQAGTIQKGKLADLVLLDANPLDRISNTRKINAVVVNGRLLDREALDGVLAQIENANAK